MSLEKSEETTELLKQLNTNLVAKDDTEETHKAVRLQMAKNAAQDMSDDEKKVARKAFETEEDKKDSKTSKKSKTANEDDDKKDGNDDEDENKTAKKSKKANEEEVEKEKIAKKSKAMEEEMKEKTANIASLTAKLHNMEAQPDIKEMVQARKQAGMSEEDLVKFESSFYGKSIKEVQSRKAEDQILFNKPLIASTPGIEIPFIGGVDSAMSQSMEGKTIEEMLQ